jgi:hypothetical protein
MARGGAGEQHVCGKLVVVPARSKGGRSRLATGGAPSG